jgi:hypothetical protein
VNPAIYSARICALASKVTYYHALNKEKYDNKLEEIIKGKSMNCLNYLILGYL